MKNRKYKIYILSSLVIVLVISLVFISLRNREQSIYIERVMLAEELQERLYDLAELRIMLEEVSFNSENMSLIARINDHRGTDFIQWVQNGLQRHIAQGEEKVLILYSGFRTLGFRFTISFCWTMTLSIMELFMN